MGSVAGSDCTQLVGNWELYCIRSHVRTVEEYAEIPIHSSPLASALEAASAIGLGECPECRLVKGNNDEIGKDLEDLAVHCFRCFCSYI